MGVTKHNIDFTNVKEGGNFSKKKMPAGDYLAKVTKVEDAVPKDKSDKTPMWLFTIQLKDTPSATYPYYCKLQDNQLWKVRNLLVAAGITVPKKKIGVDPSKVVGKLIAVSLDDTEYEGKEQSEVNGVFSPADLDGSVEVADDDDDDDVDVADDDEEEAPKPKKKKAKEPEPEEDDEDDEETGDGLDALDRTELKAYIKDNDVAVQVKKSMDDDDIRAAIRAAVTAAPEEEDEEEEDDEPEPPKKKTKAERAAARKAKAAAEAADEDDDDEIDIEDLD